MLPVVDVDHSFSLIKQNRIRMVSAPDPNNILYWILSFLKQSQNDDEIVTVFVFGSADELNRVVTKLMLSSPLYSKEKVHEIKSIMLNKFSHYFSSVALDVCLNKINEDVHISFAKRMQDPELSAEENALRSRLCFEDHRTEFFVLSQTDLSRSNPIHPLYNKPYRRVFPARHRLNLPPDQAFVVSLPSEALKSMENSDLVFLFAPEGSRSCWEPFPGFLLDLRPILDLETPPEEFEAHRSDLLGLNDSSCFSEYNGHDVSNKKVSVFILFFIFIFMGFSWIGRRFKNYNQQKSIRRKEEQSRIKEEYEMAFKRMLEERSYNIEKEFRKKFIEEYEELRQFKYENEVDLVKWRKSQSPQKYHFSDYQLEEDAVKIYKSEEASKLGTQIKCSSGKNSLLQSLEKNRRAVEPVNPREKKKKVFVNEDKLGKGLGYVPEPESESSSENDFEYSEQQWQRKEMFRRPNNYRESFLD